MSNRDEFHRLRLALEADDDRIREAIEQRANQLFEDNVSFAFLCLKIDQREIWWGKNNGEWQFHDRHTGTPVTSLGRADRYQFWIWLEKADLYKIAAEAVQAELIRRGK